MRKKSHRYIWLLSGTGDGPVLAKELVLKGWKVSVSVVSAQAALQYSELSLESLWIGALKGPEAIQGVIEKSRALHQGFDWIVDSTHPFAQVISSNLKIVCREMDQPLIRFERSCKRMEGASLIQSYKDLASLDLTGQKLLFAIGSKFLPEAVHCARSAGAIVFARALPTLEGIQKALSSELPLGHLAVLRPLKGDFVGQYEASLCRKWDITGIVLRESGGPTQKIWQKIAKEEGLDLWLISRPLITNEVCTFSSYSELLAYI